MVNVANKRLVAQSLPWGEATSVEFVPWLDQYFPQIDSIDDDSVGGGDRTQTYTYDTDPPATPYVAAYPRGVETIEVLFQDGFVLIRGRTPVTREILYVRAYPFTMVREIEFVISP